MKKILLVGLSLVLLLSLAGCGKKNASPDYSDYTVIAAKRSEGVEKGAVLTAEEVSLLMTQIESAEREKDWIDAVSNSIASCYFTIENKDGKTLYQYCDAGVLDDLTNMRSLTLGDAECTAVNELLSKYIDLKLQLAELPALGDLELKP